MWIASKATPVENFITADMKKPKIHERDSIESNYQDLILNVNSICREKSRVFEKASFERF